MTEKIILRVSIRGLERKEAERMVSILNPADESPRFKMRVKRRENGVEAEIVAKDAVAARIAVNALLRNYKLICDLRDL